MQKKIHVLQEKAVNEALSGNWKKAIDLNQQVVTLDQRNIESYLRLGFAYMQIGSFEKARKAYVKALRLQPANQIAKNNLQKIKILEKKSGSFKATSKNDGPLNPNLFLNIPGKTKVVTLIKIGQADVLAKLKIGQTALLKIKKRHVEVRTEDNEYVGALPDDISRRLIYFIEAKSEFSAFVKEASKNSVDVFIKEEKQGRKVKKYASFPKNIQDNLKAMTGDDDGKIDDSENVEEEEAVETESPVDLEVLAEEVDDAEFYPGEHRADEEDEDED